MTVDQAMSLIGISFLFLVGSIWYLMLSIKCLSDRIDMLRKRNAVFGQDISDLFEHYFKLARDVRAMQSDLINFKYGDDKFTVKAQGLQPACTWCGSTQNLANPCAKHPLYHVCPAHVRWADNCPACAMELTMER